MARTVAARRECSGTRHPPGCSAATRTAACRSIANRRRLSVSRCLFPVPVSQSTTPSIKARHKGTPPTQSPTQHGCSSTGSIHKAQRTVEGRVPVRHQLWIHRRDAVGHAHSTGRGMHKCHNTTQLRKLLAHAKDMITPQMGHVQCCHKVWGQVFQLPVCAEWAPRVDAAAAVLDQCRPHVVRSRRAGPPHHPDMSTSKAHINDSCLGHNKLQRCSDAAMQQQARS